MKDVEGLERMKRGMAWLATLLGFSSCSILGLGGGDPPPPPPASDNAGVQVVEKKLEEDTKISIQASALLNSCGSESGNILRLRVYQLKSQTVFLSASLEQLWGNEEQELGEDMLGHFDFELAPGESQELKVESVPGALYLAVAGNFCKTEGDCWRWIRPWRGVKGKINLRAGETCVETSQ